MSINCNEDSYTVGGSHDDDNYGSETYVFLYSGYYGFTSFDISSLGRVDNADWHVYIIVASNTYSVSGKLKRCLTNSINEDTITYNNMPSVTSTNEKTFSLVPPNLNNWISIDITNLINDAIDDGYDNLVLRSEITAGGAQYRHASKEYGSGSHIPYITYNEASDLYVKTTGDDTKSGLSWTNAWATVHKAMAEAVDGQTIHIGFGSYISEQDPNNTLSPDIVSDGDNVIVIYETAGTGGGSGTATVEVNPTT